MGQELVRLLCPECGTPGESDSRLTRWPCGNCGNAFFLRRCSVCARVSYVDGLQGIRMPWACMWCAQVNTGFRQNRDPVAATAAEMAADVARRGLTDVVKEPGPGGQADHAQAAAAPPPPPLPPPLPLPPPPLPPDQAAMPRSGGRARRIALPVAVAGACLAAVCVLLAARGPGAPGVTGVPGSQGGAMRTVHVTAGQVGSIIFEGVPGQVAIVGAGPGRVTLAGKLQGTRGAPTVQARLDRAADALTMSVRCAPAGSCTEHLLLTVPAGTAVAVRQPGGQLMLTNLAGPLRITAANADVRAGGLRSRDLSALITSGHLSAAFTSPPRQVSVTLASAQATLSLPADAPYRVTQQVTSGYVSVTVPRADDAARTVTARIHSGELALMPS
jgi:hypothetical protein